jgi:SM-20-related protein
MSFEPVIADLVENGWHAGLELVPAAVVAALAREARDVWHADRYATAGIGREHGHRVAPDIRGDSIFWVDDGYRSAAMAAYRLVVEELRLTLNRELFLGLESFEIMFARYADGAHYARHVDRFSDLALRTISCILYLNEGWAPGDGGELLLHLPDGCREVAPRAGTWVIFRSELIEHEVRSALRERYSLTGWFRRRAVNSPLL